MTILFVLIDIISILLGLIFMGVGSGVYSFWQLEPIRNRKIGAPRYLQMVIGAIYVILALTALPVHISSWTPMGLKGDWFLISLLFLFGLSLSIGYFRFDPLTVFKNTHKAAPVPRLFGAVITGIAIAMLIAYKNDAEISTAGIVTAVSVAAGLFATIIINVATNTPRKKQGGQGHAYGHIIFGLCVASFALAQTTLINDWVHGKKPDKINFTGPKIESVQATDNHLLRGDKTSITVRAVHSENQALKYLWSANRGTVQVGEWTYLSTIEYTAPMHSGNDTVTVTVKDEDGVITKNSLALSIVERSGPKITNIVPAKRQLVKNEKTTITVIATNPKKQSLKYFWTTDIGSVEEKGKWTSLSALEYTAPSHTGEDVVEVVVRDEDGKSDKSSISISIVAGTP